MRPRTACQQILRTSATILCLASVGGWVTVAIIGCRTAPVTERKQLLLTSEASENDMGREAYQKVLKDEPLTSNQKHQEIVQRVGQRIAAVAQKSDFDWEFNVIESDTQNAFCLPGGKVAVYSGMLPVCQTEAGLAVVMAHEVAHAIARHGGERMAHQSVQNLGKTAVGYLLQDQEEKKQEIVLTAYGAASQYGAILPYSRKHELEADEIGIMLMAKAGYDPSEAPLFWERFANLKDGSAPMEFMSTHPSDARRSATLRSLLPQAMEIYQQAPTQHGLGADLNAAN